MKSTICALMLVVNLYFIESVNANCNPVRGVLGGDSGCIQQNRNTDNDSHLILSPPIDEEALRRQQIEAQHRQEMETIRRKQETQYRRYNAYALAWGANGQYSARERASWQEAAQSALDGCSSRGPGCKLSSSSLDSSEFGCLAVTIPTDGSRVLYSGKGSSLPAAENAAMDSCRKDGKQCRLGMSGCNDGTRGTE